RVLTWGYPLGEHFYIDLVFYNYKLKCFVLQLRGSQFE
ncbi:MAG: DUF1016 family protein, partial [Deltaproteobacteria bacterium]|nr:DUF1016 family protein [Deltaproteobacteria bacterium]MBN2674217.1 DUF1016 family protein [Deltaproteobacteria bacterium]